MILKKKVKLYILAFIHQKTIKWYITQGCKTTLKPFWHLLYWHSLFWLWFDLLSTYKIKLKTESLKIDATLIPGYCSHSLPGWTMIYHWNLVFFSFFFSRSRWSWETLIFLWTLDQLKCATGEYKVVFAIFYKALYSHTIYIFSILQRTLFFLSSLCGAIDAVLSPLWRRPLLVSLCFCG